MVTKNIGLKAARYIVKDIILDVLNFPFWWYSVGLVNAFYRWLDTMRQANQELALTIWLKNIFVPMYADYSWQGRLVSFFMRLAQIIGRFVIFLLWLAVSLLFFILWLILPVFVIYEILLNLGLF